MFCLWASEPETRQGSSAGNVRTQTPARGKGQHALKLLFFFYWIWTNHYLVYSTHSAWTCFCALAVKDPSPEELLRQLQEERTCKVCMDKLVSIVFIPCGHLVVCGDCAASLRHCPICRAVVRGSVRAFMSWRCGENPLVYRHDYSWRALSISQWQQECWLLVVSYFTDHFL